MAVVSRSKAGFGARSARPAYTHEFLINGEKSYGYGTLSRSAMPEAEPELARRTGVLITSHGEVVAEIRPPAALNRSRRQPGALRGRIRMAPDFDTLPEDLLAAMEGDEA